MNAPSREPRPSGVQPSNRVRPAQEASAMRRDQRPRIDVGRSILPRASLATGSLASLRGLRDGCGLDVEFARPAKNKTAPPHQRARRGRIRGNPSSQPAKLGCIASRIRGGNREISLAPEPASLHCHACNPPLTEPSSGLTSPSPEKSPPRRCALPAVYQTSISGSSTPRRCQPCPTVRPGRWCRSLRHIPVAA